MKPLQHLRKAGPVARWSTILCIAVLAACGGGDRVWELGTRAVVIGIDGADPVIVDALAAEGHLPNLSRLRQRGVWGEIETLHDIPLSPVVWTSVATGKTADQHGISWFMVDRPDGTRAPVRSHNRKVKAIWNILADERRRPTAIGWWATYPAEDVGGGTIVSDGLGFHGFGATARFGDDGRKTWPPELYSEVSVLVPPEQQISAEFAQRFFHVSAERYRAAMYTPARNVRRDPLNPFHLFQQYAVTAEGYTSIAERLLQRPYDLFLVYYEQVDSFSHLFMKYAPPRLDWIDEARYERFRDVVTEWYKHQDALLGRLLEKIDLETTAVFVLSDHGFKSGERRIRSEETVDVRKAHLDHEPHGIFLAVGPYLRPGDEIGGASVLDLTPTLLHYLGFPVAQDMAGKVLERIFLPEFLESNPIRYVATYEEDEPEERRTRPEDAEELGEQQLADNLEALRALGYVGGSPQEETAAGPAEEESSPEIHNNLGRIHLRKGELQEARREFEAALQLDPDNAEALLNIGTIHRSQGRQAQAEQLVKRALQVDPNSVGALAELAELRRDQQDFAEAIRLFEEALRVNDSQPFLYVGLGDALQRAGRLDEAVDAFNRALELDPDSHKAHYNLGVTLSRQGETDRAVAHYEKALELAPAAAEAANAHNNLGAIHLDRNEIDQAAARFRQAAAASPHNLESRYNLALLHLEQGEVAQAIERLEEAAALAPDHELVNLRLGATYLMAGRDQDAYRSYLLVRRLYPSNWAAAVGLAALHARAGERDRARALLADAVALGGNAARQRAATFPVLTELLD